jgi:hypothetical protein
VVTCPKYWPDWRMFASAEFDLQIDKLSLLSKNQSLPV